MHRQTEIWDPVAWALLEKLEPPGSSDVCYIDLNRKAGLLRRPSYYT